MPTMKLKLVKLTFRKQKNTGNYLLEKIEGAVQVASSMVTCGVGDFLGTKEVQSFVDAAHNYSVVVLAHK
jgi:hypothetical protein